MKSWKRSNKYGWYRILQICSIADIVKAIYFNKEEGLFRVPVTCQVLIEWVDESWINKILDSDKNADVNQIINDHEEDVSFNTDIDFLIPSTDGEFDIPDEEGSFLGYEFNGETTDWSKEMDQIRKQK